MTDQVKNTVLNVVDGSVTQKLLVCQHCALELPPGSTNCPQHGPIAGSEDLLIKELGNRYEFISLVSTGGMGVIYKAKQLLLDKTVAIKMLHSHMGSDQSLARFQKEAKAASTLEHPGIIRVHDFGISEHGQAFMVMDFVEGKPLSRLIEEQGQLEPKLACQIFVQVLEAVEHAHSKGVLHRDLKPSNIMISHNSDGSLQAKLVDFGIAKIQDQVSLTQTGDVIGSPPYMSPEQCRGHNIDHRSDIYSLGCVMYETLTGQPPHTGESLVEIIFKQLNEKSVPITKARPDLKFPAALTQIIHTTLEKDPKDRYQAVAGIRTDLEKLFKAQFAVSYINRRRLRFLKTMVALALISWTCSILLVVNNKPDEHYRMTSSQYKRLIKESSTATTLELMNQIIDDRSFDDRDLAMLSNLENLEVLNVRYTNVTDKGLSALSNMKKLKELRLSSTQVKGPGLKYLKSLPNLQALSLSLLSISPGGLSTLPEFKHLTDLHISLHPLTDESLQAVSQLQTLHNLEIKNAGINDDNIAFLSRLKELKSLDITANPITDRSMSEILKLKHLTVLHMGATQVTDKGVSMLSQLPNLTYVKIMGGPYVTLKGLEDLRRAMPNCVID